jgi:C4-dicarboxylate-specific signal transduction histidine kinase
MYARGYAEQVRNSPPNQNDAPASNSVSELERRIDQLERAVETLSKTEDKIAGITQWFAIAISFMVAFTGVMSFVMLLYERSVRTSHQTMLAEFREVTKESVEHKLKVSQQEIFEHSDKRMDDRIAFLITSELRNIAQTVESKYSRNLALVENVLYSTLQNEFIRHCDAHPNNVQKGIEYLHVFRHLLILLVAGNANERLTALGRLHNEFSQSLGPTSKAFLCNLLDQLESDARFARLELATALAALKEKCSGL